MLQTTTCSTKDLHEDIDGWRKAFTKELDSLDWLKVKTNVWESALDVSKEEVPPSRDVMVKKPVGDGTHLKKGRVVVCGNFQQVQPGEDTCKHTVVSDVANAYFVGVIATLGSSVMGCVNSILVRPVAGRAYCVLQTAKRIGEVGSCKTRCGSEVKQTSLRPEDITKGLGRGKR